MKSHVRINMNEPDPEIRNKGLFMDFNTFLRTKKWDHLVESNPKLVISQMFTLLKPPELRNKIEYDLEIGKQKLRKKLLPFYNRCVMAVVAWDKFDFIESTHDSNSSEQAKPPFRESSWKKEA